VEEGGPLGNAQQAALMANQPDNCHWSSFHTEVTNFGKIWTIFSHECHWT